MQDNPVHNYWLRQIAEGDETAFRNLFDMYWDQVYSAAFLLTKSQSLSEDIVQEVFLKIWLKREELVGVEKLESYLFIMARNHIYNVLKRQQREQDFRKYILDWFESGRETPELTLLFKESTQLLQQAVGQLTEQQQTIYKMTREQGLSYDQVAQQLNISPNTVKNHVANSLKIIRDYLRAHASPLTLAITFLGSLR